MVRFDSSGCSGGRRGVSALCTVASNSGGPLSPLFLRIRGSNDSGTTPYHAQSLSNNAQRVLRLGSTPRVDGAKALLFRGKGRYISTSERATYGDLWRACSEKVAAVLRTGLEDAHRGPARRCWLAVGLLEPWPSVTHARPGLLPFHAGQSWSGIDQTHCLIEYRRRESRVRSPLLENLKSKWYHRSKPPHPPVHLVPHSSSLHSISTSPSRSSKSSKALCFLHSSFETPKRTAAAVEAGTGWFPPSWAAGGPSPPRSHRSCYHHLGDRV